MDNEQDTVTHTMVLMLNLVLNKHMRVTSVKDRISASKKAINVIDIQSEEKYEGTVCHLTWVLKARILIVVMNWMFLQCLNRSEMPQIQVSTSY